MVIAAGLGAGGIYALMSPDGVAVPSGFAAAAAFQASGQQCNIKGNVSMKNGERIYHVPGQKYYADTKIDARYGERWFCSEKEAREAGWRKSRV